MTSYTNSLIEYFLFIYCCSYNMRTSRLPIPLMLSKSAFNFITLKVWTLPASPFTYAHAWTLGLTDSLLKLAAPLL